MNTLLTEMCFNKNIDSSTLRDALKQLNGDGLTPLQICGNENTVLKIMNCDQIDVGRDIDSGHLDAKGNNVLHIYAKKNFVGCVREIFKAKYLQQDDVRIKELLLQKNDNGNNPLMSCVLKSSNDTLNYLLCTVFSMVCGERNNDLMRSILHEKNSKTLYSIKVSEEKCD